MVTSQLRIEDSESREINELELGPRCSKTFYLSLNCPMDGNYSWEIYYEITKTKFSTKDLLCHVTAEVCYPILKMAHMSCSEIIPKELLYELTNAKKIDELLSTTPGDDHQTDQSESEEMIEVNFNCATYRSAPYIIRLEVFNPGNTDAKFKFKFPADFRMDLEGWAQHSTLSQDEYGILKIEENKLFQIIPKSGILKSNQRQVIKMVYSHNMIGQHSFPVILDIHGGRQIPLRLSGITRSESDKYLNFAVDHHQLRPVQLG